MAGYDSPIGKKQYRGQPFKEVVIPDESSTPPQQNQQLEGMDAIRELNTRLNGQQTTSLPEDVERQFREAREAKRFGKERLTEGARRRIEMLVGMTRVTRQFNIDGNDYVLQTLRSGELRDAVIAASAFDGTVQSPFEIRKQLLARSLVQIAGMDAAQFFGSNEIEDKLEAIELFDHYLLGRLYDEYLKMVKEAQDKYAVKTPEEAKEVMEDLKK
jgi:hypothetical protein